MNFESYSLQVIRFSLIPFFILSSTLVSGCVSMTRKFSQKEVLWVDKDRNPISKPKDYWSPIVWDGVDYSFFRPLTRIFKVDPVGEAINVNAFDEVPDSSWFENRIGKELLTPKAAAQGACGNLEVPKAPFYVVSGKSGGATPGFVIETSNAKRYLMKFDHPPQQHERSTAADVFGSLLYHAAGFNTPCNQITYIKPGDRVINKNAKFKNEYGAEVNFTDEDIKLAMKSATVYPNGYLRASTSRFVDGSPIGPWRYEGTREDDPNDVVPHEYRRELRGVSLLASWINHFDHREHNTLASWIKSTPAKGYVKHWFIDFSDSFGLLSGNKELSKRAGHAYILDWELLFTDWLTLGVIKRPWDSPKHGKAGVHLGFFNDTDRFEPVKWKNEYPNPAFSELTNRDGAWMARIIAEFKESHISAMLDKLELRNKLVRGELQRILIGRQKKILKNWLERVSPLSHPKLERNYLCVRDMAVYSGTRKTGERNYWSETWVRNRTGRVISSEVLRKVGRICFRTNFDDTNPQDKEYIVMSLHSDLNYGTKIPPLHVHIGKDASGTRSILGLERPYSSEANSKKIVARK